MKLIYMVVCFLLINLYAFEGIDFYKNGEYKKAEKAFIEYIKKTNSNVAKAYLAKIYYKEGKYKKAEKIINELLNDKTVPDVVKKDLQNLLLTIKGKKNIVPVVRASLEVLYDSNVKLDSSKKRDFAHIEELLAGGSYLNENFKTFMFIKVQNKKYFRYNEEDYQLFSTYLYVTHYSSINSRFKLGFERQTTNANFYTSEIYLFKKFNTLEAGVFSIGDYYKTADLKYKNLGGGVRIGLFKKSFNTKISLMSYYSNYNDNTLDNRNYKIDIKNIWSFPKFYIFMNYYYNFSKFHDFINNFHYLDVSFNSKINKHLDYSVGMSSYYSLIHTFNYQVKKNEIYTKFIYNF